MSTLRPKNWAEFQHYKDRSPAWIKLHRGILDDFDYSCLPLASKALAPLLWLLASEHKDGDFSSDPARIAHRLRWSVDEVVAGLKPLIDKGFFVLASGVLAECYQDACLEERRGEDIKQRGEKNIVRSTPAPDERFDLARKVYPKRAGTNSWTDARKQWDARIKAGVDPDTMLDGTFRYAHFAKETGKVGTEMVMQAARFYGSGKNYEGEFPVPVQPAEAPSKSMQAIMNLEGMRNGVATKRTDNRIPEAVVLAIGSDSRCGDDGWGGNGLGGGSDDWQEVG